MATRNTQDKATTERNARTLRELVKRPENKVCGDCKRNDPRWASWNLGIFICIRCSGIHRSMGTHISKVKSVDLDMWTPEQMRNIQLWGNARANLYWEAHLKPGHMPPDHKIESFIRSKYESRRWAMEGPPPADPSVLEEGSVAAEAPAPPAPIGSPEPVISPATASKVAAAAPVTTVVAPRGHALLSSMARTRAAAPTTNPSTTLQNSAPAPAAPAPTPASSTQADLFSLDFTPPSTSASAPLASQPSASATKNVKNDILSLFNTAAPAATTPASQFGAFSHAAAPAQPNPPATSFMGSNGTGMWGASSGWNAPPAPAAADPWGSFASGAAPAAAAPPSAFGGNVWSTTPASSVANANVDLNNVWGAPAASSGTASSATGAGFGGDLFGSLTSGTSGSTSATTQAKKDDAFGDLWGGFK